MRMIPEPKLIILLSILLLCACASGEQDAQREAELSRLAQEGEWKEIELRVEVLETEGASGAYLDYYRGLAQLWQDEDLPAEKSFDQAVAADSNLAFDVAREYRAAAQRDLDGEWQRRAAKRMLRAYRLDLDPEMGELGTLVVDLIFNMKDYQGAIPVFRHLLATQGDEVERQRWRFRLGLCLEQSGYKAAGLEEYRKFWVEFPDLQGSSYKSYVLWRQAILLLDFAQERMEHGDCEGALEHLEEVLTLHSHAEHRADAFYRRGLCLEDLNRIDEAKESYRNALRYPTGQGAAIDEQVRERLRVLSEEGR